MKFTPGKLYSVREETTFWQRRDELSELNMGSLPKGTYVLFLGPHYHDNGRTKRSVLFVEVLYGDRIGNVSKENLEKIPLR